jgi:VanZ family protein
MAIFWSMFIFFNSLMPASVSASQSGVIRDLIYPVFTNMGIKVNLNSLEFFIRKLAHFSIFFIFSVLWFSYFSLLMPRKKTIQLVLVLGFIQAVTDETIQRFVDGRSGELRDVLIDYLGVLSGIVFFLGVSRLLSHIKTRQSSKTSLQD